jgi:hypothetical protein
MMVYAGWPCYVIHGANAGLPVMVRAYGGDHPKRGRMWRCDVMHMPFALNRLILLADGSYSPRGLFPQSWLRPFPSSGAPGTYLPPLNIIINGAAAALQKEKEHA